MNIILLFRRGRKIIKANNGWETSKWAVKGEDGAFDEDATFKNAFASFSSLNWDNLTTQLLKNFRRSYDNGQLLKALNARPQESVSTTQNQVNTTQNLVNTLPANRFSINAVSGEFANPQVSSSAFQWLPNETPTPEAVTPLPTPLPAVRNFGLKRSNRYNMTLDQKAAMMAKRYGLDTATFGTADALAKWQEANGFTGDDIDGDFGNKTRDKLILMGLIKSPSIKKEVIDYNHNPTNPNMHADGNLRIVAGDDHYVSLGVINALDKFYTDPKNKGKYTVKFLNSTYYHDPNTHEYYILSGNNWRRVLLGKATTKLSTKKENDNSNVYKVSKLWMDYLYSKRFINTVTSPNGVRFELTHKGKWLANIGNKWIPVTT